MALTPHPLDRQRRTLSLESQSLGDGGQGVVTRLTGAEPLVYKEYMPHAGTVNGTALAQLIEFVHGLAPQERRVLMEQCAWPVARVVDGDRVTGFLMPLLPDDFYWVIGRNRKPVELQYLLYKPNWAWQGMPLPDIQGRVEIALAAARLIDRLHHHGWVIGDISFRNLLWRPIAPYRIFMIDCDGLRRHGDEAVLRQAHTPDWDDPHQPATGPDLDSDRYKLALLVARVLSRTASVRPGQELTLLPGLEQPTVNAVRELFARAKGPHGTRPAASEWVQALLGRKWIAVTRPAVRRPSAPARPSVPLLAPGAARGSIPVRRPPRPAPAPASVSVSAPPSSPPRSRIPVRTVSEPPEGRPSVAVPPVAGATAPPPSPTTPAVPTLGQRVVDSDRFAEERPARSVLSDEDIARFIDHLVTRNGRAPLAEVTRLLGQPADWASLLMGAIRPLFNIDDFEVITLQDGDRSIQLNVRLLKELFLEED
ncbi:hypothetical protein AB0K60_12215 [Thermopolyspora sp. NPDC052614]|uniref:hypothetical protein n=1 Tax=Thermopolyspora sp. NPDC052614 TaxID=3155682 RepID=UPI00342C1CCC